jgi:phosphate-selective porin OprO/OprP
MSNTKRLVILCLFLLAPVSGFADQWRFPVLKFLTGTPVQSDDGSYIRMGGRVQADANYYEGAMNNANGGDWDEDYFIRRARLSFAAEWKSTYFLYLQAPFESTANDDFIDAYLVYKGLGPTAWIRLGKQKEVLGLEALSSGTVLPFIERSAVTRALINIRNKGAAMLGNIKSWSYMVGVFDINGFDSSDHNWSYNARLVKKHEHPNGDVFHWGVNLSSRDQDLGAVVTQPEVQKVDKRDRISSGALAADGKDLFGVEILKIQDNWHLSSEAYFSDYKNAVQDDYQVWGTYLAGGWILTGEKRQYKSTYGTFGTVTPQNSFGAWELVGRLSYLDLADKGQGNKAGMLTLGLNWFANRHISVMGNLIYADYDQAPDADALSGVTSVGDSDGFGASLRVQLVW